MQYLVTFQSHTGRQAETIEADSHSREAGGTSIVFRAVQRVAFTDREVVVRRLDAEVVDTITTV